MVDNIQIGACLIELKLLDTDNPMDPDESLFDRGIIDSLGIGSLVGLLQIRYGIIVPDEDLLPANFDSISSIARYVNAKLDSANSSQV